MPRNYIVDSSALVAVVRQDDQYHAWIASHLNAIPAPWLTCEAALAEAFYIVGNRGAPVLKELLRRDIIKMNFDLGDELDAVLDLMDKYANVPMSLADACLVRMSETLADPIIVTTDSDFRIYRRHSRQVIPCLTP